MGKQVNFFFVEEDEKEFLKRLNGEDIVLLKKNTEQPRNEIYDEFHLSPNKEASQSQSYICLKTYLSEVKYEAVEEHGYFYIESFASPVIEFSRSGLNPESDILVSGRIYYQHTYWDEDENGNDILLEKPEEPEKLYNRLARWIRKYCKRLPNDYRYIGPHALELYKKGARLSP